MSHLSKINNNEADKTEEEDKRGIEDDRSIQGNMEELEESRAKPVLGGREREKREREEEEEVGGEKEIIRRCWRGVSEENLGEPLLISSALLSCFSSTHSFLPLSPVFSSYFCLFCLCALDGPGPSSPPPVSYLPLN